MGEIKFPRSIEQVSALSLFVCLDWPRRVDDLLPSVPPV